MRKIRKETNINDNLGLVKKLNEREILEYNGKVTAEMAKAFAESKFENIESCSMDYLKVILID